MRLALDQHRERAVSLLNGLDSRLAGNLVREILGLQAIASPRAIDPND
jgi:hypothetical protein